MADSILTNAQDFTFKGIDLHGSCEGWEDDMAMRLASYEYLKRDGAEVDPNGAAQKKWSFSCVYMGADCGTRYKNLAAAGVRNIEEFNAQGGNMRYKFVVVDEFGDLAVGNYVLEETVKTGEVFSRGMRAGEEKVRIEKLNLSDGISRSILVLAQKARAAGIHLIIATQRPSVDIITGSIKANFPTKVAFRTAKAVDSQVMLDEAGAEKLLGKGDMLFAGDFGQVRLQGFNS